MNGLPLSTLRAGAIVALASFALAACGADDGNTFSNTAPAAPQANSHAPSAPDAVAPPLPSASAGSAANAFNTPASNSVNDAANAQDNVAIYSAQASLAADSQQVSPVLRYAPGDQSH
ncbi:hypothetical protein [Paraburkholderia sp. C35]|uniref:hypothetical protein n=1 Tax=Paraburkholderia sp. C35 TaxID=2126993 RepID=UPI000D698DEC|nr:hypothetical protein [Paraburkholderia sp. C35]